MWRWTTWHPTWRGQLIWAARQLCHRPTSPSSACPLHFSRSRRTRHRILERSGQLATRKIIEYTLVSLDGVFEDPARRGFMEYRDDANSGRIGLAAGVRRDADGANNL